MNLRYYFRGLGIGITITAILLIFLQSDKNGMMTDAEVKKRAAELGMVESTTLANLSSERNSEKASEPAVTSEPAGETGSEAYSQELPSEEEPVTSDGDSEAPSEEGSEPVSVEPASEPASEPVSEAASEPVSETQSETPSDEGAESEEDYVIITVNRGDGSGTVARKVYEAGLVADAYDYDRYLCSNGYDKRIAAGNHKIKKGATEKEIADSLCSRS